MLLGRVEMLKRRRTKIVATVGPSSSDSVTLERLLAAGVNVVRLNMSHGEHDGHARAYKEVRAAEAAAGVPVAVLADLCGPKLRVGKFAGGAIDLTPGETCVLTTRDVEGGDGVIPSQYTTLHVEIDPGARVLLDDGRLELRVDDVHGRDMACSVVRGGRLKDHKGINLPGTRLSAPALTDKDRADAAFAVELGVDYLALSFVRRAADVAALRAMLPADAEERPGIVAKIEHPDALAEIDAIVDAADAVMVARGDLGVELPAEEVPVVQRELTRLARAKGKPCIVATQMLESMIEHPTPTRAEVSDVSTAVFGGADAVMLSAETATGRYPVEAVSMMDRIARQVEAYEFSESGFVLGPAESPHEASFLDHSVPVRQAVAVAAAQLSRDLRVRAIVAISSSGATARALAAARPAAPVVAVSPLERTARQLALVWGVAPVFDPASADAPADTARRVAGEQGLAEAGHRVLKVAGLGGDGTVEPAPTISVLTV